MHDQEVRKGKTLKPKTYNRSPKYYMRITDNVDTQNGPHGRISHAKNKYVVWSTHDKFPVCSITREEIMRETEGFIKPTLRLAALDGPEAVASLFATRAELLDSSNYQHHAEIEMIYDALPTFIEWKESNVDRTNNE